MILGTLVGGAAIALLAMTLHLGGSTRMPRSAVNPPTPAEMRAHILWRSFYVNPDDPRGWVPKISGYGWTVNFRTRRNAAIFASLIAFCLGSALALAALSLACG